MGDLTNLELLYLSDAQFSGAIPPELGNLTKLERLSFNNNQLSGSIPSELGDLTALKLLSLSNNQFSGTIPSELGDLTNLEYLYFNYNQLSGSIPSELGDLTNLKRLYFHGNQFSGTLPSALENLTNLTATYFSVDYNASSLCLPTTPTTVKDWYSSKGFWTTSLCGTTAPGSVAVTVPDNARVGLQVTWTAPTNTAFTTNGYHIDYSTDGKTWRSQQRKLVAGGDERASHRPDRWPILLRAGAGHRPDGDQHHRLHFLLREHVGRALLPAVAPSGFWRAADQQSGLRHRSGRPPRPACRHQPLDPDLHPHRSQPRCR